MFIVSEEATVLNLGYDLSIDRDTFLLEVQLYPIQFDSFLFVDHIFDVSQSFPVESFVKFQSLGYSDFSSVQFVFSHVRRSDKSVSCPCVFKIHKNMCYRNCRIVTVCSSFIPVALIDSMDNGFHVLFFAFSFESMQNGFAVRWSVTPICLVHRESVCVQLPLDLFLLH